MNRLGIDIREAVPDDAYHIAKVSVDSWRTTYSDILPKKFLSNLSYEKRTESWKNNLARRNVFVAVTDEQQIVGFSSGGKERTGHYVNFIGEVYSIYILKDFQRLGIGKLLFRQVVNELIKINVDSLLVWVLENNRSRLFYENLGGEQVDVKEIEIGEEKYKEIAYGWRNIKVLNKGLI